ncbi:hypothetical protein CXB51_016981 [Gossypium anomalum]|uniref:Uncharacterized protein n=1 Tax=Gossypium anomalum TaxID=47600 RepID=A0A8J5Z539_9ROSI|nr:hypothetical protein CXB51_016981 [Gossypium anomalum]
MRNTDSVMMALNSHFDHHRIEIKKILPKISFTLSLQTCSKLLLSSQQCIFSYNSTLKSLSFRGDDVSSCSISRGYAQRENYFLIKDGRVHGSDLRRTCLLDGG